MVRGGRQQDFKTLAIDGGSATCHASSPLPTRNSAMTIDGPSASCLPCSSEAADVPPRSARSPQQASATNGSDNAVYHRSASRRPCTTTRDGCEVTQSWRPTQHYSPAYTLCLAALFGLLLLCDGVRANNNVLVARRWEYGDAAELIFDRSIPPARPMQLHARRDTSSSGLPSSIGVPTSTGASSASAAETAGTIATAAPTSASLPQPFDSGVGTNFTSSSCPDFFNAFLSNDTFQACLPLSMLLQTSNSFFDAERSLVRLTQTLSATCAVDFQTCSAVMDDLAQSIKQSSTCGPDLDRENPMAVQAYNALVAYETLYYAGCLTDSQGDYCFANAITNRSAPTSGYIYYLPLGVDLPTNTDPTCNKCLGDTMTVFANAAGNNSVPLAADYMSAAHIVDTQCGSSFVGAAVTQTSPAAAVAVPPLALASLVTLLFVIWNLLVV